ncbi:uncharacterized protein [Macrobrachium rosenbergii]|uniref:uncharacterized protein n=1 Tax=Macrobrachium rosenbergii TaxID=79674 RepID=UPI0034D40BEA
MCTTTDRDGRESIKLDGKEIRTVNKFKYLGSIVESGGRMDEKVKNKILAGWDNWKAASGVSGVLCDKRVPLRLKGKFHKAVVRPAMLYGTETANITKTEEKKLDVEEMRRLVWMSVVIREDRIWNEYIRGLTKVAEISKKVQEGRMRRYGLRLRREEDHLGRHAMEMEA